MEDSEMKIMGFLGTVLATIISYDAYHDVIWAILHGFCGWLYVIYWLIFIYWI